MSPEERIAAMINRIARLNAAQSRLPNLNAVQVAALRYLSRANRFSRSPSHLAEYLGTTRGTMSQTLKSLEKKGFVEENRSQTDKRSISYHLTDSGLACLADAAAEADGSVLDKAGNRQLADLLTKYLAGKLAAMGHRPFGICRDCRYHKKTAAGAYCDLLDLELQPLETEQICHEQIAA